MKKSDLENIKVEGFERFTFNGEVWTPNEKVGKNRGTSERGLWTDFRSESGDTIRIYKEDLDVNAAALLFNGSVNAYKSALKKKREETGMSQTALAHISGVDVRMIQNYEQGANNINKAAVETVLKLADSLGCDLREILNNH